MKRQLLTLVTALSFAACSGGGGTSIPAPGQNAPKVPQSANVAFVVKIPPAQSQSASSRRPHWITSNVQGVQISVVQSPATTASGFNFYPVNASEPYCSGGGSAPLVCTLALQAPPGNDVFTVQTLDSPNYTGYYISSGTVTAQISAGMANTINITTGGVVTEIYANYDNPCAIVGQSGTFPVRAIAADYDNNIIIGNYDMPLTVQLTDTSGATSVNETTINSSADLSNLALTYNGANASPVGSMKIVATSPVSAQDAGTVSFTVRSLYPSSATSPCITLTPSLLVLGSNTASGTVSVGTVNTSTAGVYTATVGTANPGSPNGSRPTLVVSGSSPTFTINANGGGGMGGISYKDTANGNISRFGFVFVQ